MGCPRSALGVRPLELESFSVPVVKSVGRRPEYDVVSEAQADCSIRGRPVLIFTFSRLLYLSYSLVRGNFFNSSKFHAIVLGDMSGNQVHPFFVLFSEFSGRHFYQVRRAQWLFWEAQGILAHLTFRSLMTMKVEDDPISYVQAHWSMAAGLMTAGSPAIARRHYQMALQAVKEHDIRFVKHPPNPGTGLSFTEKDHERAALLGKIIHFESFLSLYLTGLPGASPWDDGNREGTLSVGSNILRSRELTQ